MTTIIGIDPGPELCGVVEIDCGGATEECPPRVARAYSQLAVSELLAGLMLPSPEDVIVAVETISPRGRFTTVQAIRTAIVVGKILGVCPARIRALEIHPSTWRADICGDASASPAKIKACVRDVYRGVATGAGRDHYKGTKQHPGPLYMLAGDHAWDALGVALHTWRQQEVRL